jgi:hypothetical protein
MKFTVDLEDFYLEEGEVADELKKHVISSVVSEISKQIKDQVSKFMDTYLKEKLNTELNTRVQLIMDDFIATGTVKGHYSGDPDLTVKGWVSKVFQSKSPDILNGIKIQVTAHAKALQDRYDLNFALGIVTKLKDQGLLKEEAVKMLLDDKTT